MGRFKALSYEVLLIFVFIKAKIIHDNMTFCFQPSWKPRNLCLSDIPITAVSTASTYCPAFWCPRPAERRHCTPDWQLPGMYTEISCYRGNRIQTRGWDHGQSKWHHGYNTNVWFDENAWEFTYLPCRIFPRVLLPQNLLCDAMTSYCAGPCRHIRGRDQTSLH